MKDRIVWLMITAICLATCAQAGVAYMDPFTGWAYIHNGDAASAADGTWDHNNGSDQWDDSAIGSGRPGGVSLLTEGDVTYVRIQDTGDPRDHGFGDPGSNRKIMLTHDTRLDADAAVADNALDNGVTLSFRARIATTGPLDDTYYNGQGGTSDPWPAAGNGHIIHSGGKGMFQYFQDGNGEHIVAFSLCLDTDPDDGNFPITADGLTMNNHNGNARSGSVDTGEGGTQNILSGFDPTEWHEFWINIVEDYVVGTHTVTIWMDGSFTPAGTFTVTSGTGNDEGYSYIGVGSGNTNTSAAFDVDFFAWAPGAMEPPDPSFNPPPIVDAGPAQEVYVGEAAQLSGSVTDMDPADGSYTGTLSSYWIGPAEATFEPADTTNILDPQVTFSATGVYELMLQASDGQKDANDVVTILVKDHADEMLVGYWPFDGDALDNGENAEKSDGTLIKELGYPKFVADAAVGSASISLADPNVTDPNLPHVDLGPATELDFGTNSWTVCAWIKTTQSGTGDANKGNFFNNGGDTGGGHRYTLILSEQSEGNVTLVTDDDSNKYQTRTTTPVNDGVWHFIVGMRDRLNGTRIYRDGVLEGSNTTVPMDYDLSGTSQLHSTIGVGIDWNGSPEASVPYKHYTGLIDDVRVYNYALPYDDPDYVDILDLIGMGPIVATVDAGADIDFNWKPGSSLDLNGVVTDLGAPDGKTILWTTELGPGDAEATFDPADSAATTASFTEPGVYVLKLTVIDPDAVDPISDTVQVTVNAPTCADVIADGLNLANDLDGDCHVGLSDLAIVLADYLKCNDPLDPLCEWPF